MLDSYKELYVCYLLFLIVMKTTMMIDDADSVPSPVRHFVFINLTLYNNSMR